jgi:hypothetical protein
VKQVKSYTVTHCFDSSSEKIPVIHHILTTNEDEEIRSFPKTFYTLNEGGLYTYSGRGSTDGGGGRCVGSRFVNSV